MWRLCACGAPPDRDSRDEPCPLMPPFSLVLREEEEELSLEVDALLLNCFILQSGEEQHGETSDQSMISGHAFHRSVKGHSREKNKMVCPPLGHPFLEASQC